MTMVNPLGDFQLLSFVAVSVAYMLINNSVHLLYSGSMLLIQPQLNGV